MTSKKNAPAIALNSLMLAALSLPGIQGAKAEVPVTRPEADLSYTAYDEGRSRYHIDIYLAQLKTSLSEKMDFEIKALQEIQSGASVFGYAPALLYGTGPISQLIQVHSEPTIHSVRNEVSMKPRYFGEDYNVGITASLSEEEKYESKTVGIDYTKELNKQNTELSFGYSFSSDAIKATPQANGLFVIRDPDRHDLITNRFDFSIKQDLSKTTLARAGVEFIADRGFLNDPYKLAFLWGNAVGLRPGAYYFTGGFGVPGTIVLDSRPKYRGTLGTSVKIIQKIESLDSAVHFGYRFVKNTWSIQSHTFNLDYYQQLGSSFEVVPSLRYYAQTEAYFYAMAFDIVGNAPFPAKLISPTAPVSSDYRLARYGSITGELKFNYKFMADQSGKFTVILGMIDRRNKLYWGRKIFPLNPNNDFKTYYGSIGLKYVF